MQSHNPYGENPFSGPQSGGSQYGPPQYGPMPPGSVKNYLLESALVTAFCCPPLGFVAIIFAAQVDGKLRQGDYQGAVQSSNYARMFFILSLVLGIFSTCGCCILSLLMGVAGA